MREAGIACRIIEGTLGLKLLSSCNSVWLPLPSNPRSTASLKVLPAMFENAKKPDSKLAGVSPQERRVHPRYPSVRQPKRSTQRRGFSGAPDLSRGGCYVDTINPFPMGAEVRIRISKGNLTFVAPAKVMYAAAGMGMGLMFTKIEPHRLQVPQEWLRELSGESPSAPSEMSEQSEQNHHTGNANSNEQQYVLNELIIALMRKQILSDAEGKAMRKKLMN
jgi:PilZ domain